MAQISLTLKNVECHGTTTKTDVVGTSNITVSSEITYSNTVQPSSTNNESSDSGSVYLMIDSEDSTIEQYTLYLVNLSFLKKMYQPAEMNAEIHIKGDSSIPLSVLEKTFKHVNIDLMCDGKSIGSGYYVHEVQALYKKEGTKEVMYVTLKIFTLDKLLTLNKVSRAFVAQKLSTILTSELKNYKAPYDNTALVFDTTNMNILNYTEGSTNSEHIFPYLVQYNESFYDMLARTANRWGEFMYFEDGQLHFGYNKKGTVDSVSNYSDRYYFDVYDSANEKNLTVSNAGNYDVLASNDDQFIGNKLKRDPKEVSGIMYYPNKKFDKVAMKKLANLFKLDKSLPTFIGYEIADDVFDVASKFSSVAVLNNQFNDKYFTEEEKDGKKVLSSKAPGLKEQRDSDNKEYNQFTELGTKYDNSKYKGILSKELAAGLNALSINFETNYPALKLGQMIEIDGKNYIVVEISCKKKTSEDYKLAEVDGKTPKEYKLEKTTTYNYVFNVVALAQDGTNEKDFYPAVIPAGHIRLAEPQIATITDASDPSGNNQVRVVFPWQYDAKTKISGAPTKPEEAEKEATPWLKFATNASGSPVVGKHYKGNNVLVGFIDGNVERPYVLGGLEAKGDSSADVIQTTPGGHSLKINDDPAGVTKFMTGMFLPGWKTLSSFVPQMNQIETDMDADSKLGGGFELTDNYGIYKISGSTDGRNVTVASPWGDVAINAFTGITISAPNGDISIKGKNVSIEAGNNLTLKSGMNVNYHFAQKKTTAGGCVSQFLLDVAAAVARRMTEKMITIVDLSMIRSMWEIVMRPQEGCLTVKSHRYLKLASGNNECAYPAEGYSEFKKNNIYDKFVNKREAKVASGLAIGCPGEGSAMREIFETISPMVDDLDQKYKKVWNKCFDLKVKLSQRFSLLDAWVNDPTKRAIQGSNFNDLYDNKLKADLWKDGKYEPFKESDLNKWLSDEVKVDGDLNTIVSDACINTHKLEYPKVEHDNHSLRLCIVEKRKELRKNVLKAANELRKEINNLLNLEFNPADINKKLSWFVTTPAPKDYKKKMNTSFSREKCVKSNYYRFLANDDRKSLAAKIGDADKALYDADIIYMKRVVAMNMLDQLGFRDDMRKPLVVGGPIPPKPDANDSATVIDDDIWENYVNSISGIPPLGRDKTAIGGGMEAALDAAWSKINIWGSAIEWFTWGEGKKGQILFNGGNGTLKLADKTFADITPLDPKAKYLTDDDLSESEQHTVNSFLEHMKLGLRTL